MVSRIEVASRREDAKSLIRKKELESLSFSGKIRDVKIVDVYTVDSSLKRKEQKEVASLLVNSVFQDAKINEPSNVGRFAYAVEIGFLPGVTDNIGNTARESIEDIAGITDESGRILGMMPHPERAIDFTHLPHWTLLKEQYKRAGKEIPNESYGLEIFKNGVRYFR